MKTTPLALLLIFLFIFSSSSVAFADDFQDAVDAHEIKDYKTAHKLWLPLAEQGNADSQNMLGAIYNE